MTMSFRAIAPAFALALLSTTACDRAQEEAGAPDHLEEAKPRETTDPGTPPLPAAPQPAGFRCAVLVRGSTGSPLPSVHVDFLREAGTLVAGQLTDDRGVARFRVPAGNYNVRIANHEREVLAEVGYEVSGDTPTPIEVVLGRK